LNTPLFTKELAPKGIFFNFSKKIASATKGWLNGYFEGMGFINKENF